MTGPTACDQILDVIERDRHSRDWLFWRELRVGAGHGGDAQQRIDGFAVHCFPHKNHLRFAYEVKVSRADFLRELAKPIKRRRALLMSNQFFFVTPPGIVKPEELPLECGLIEILPEPTGNYYAHQHRIVVDAPFRDGRPPTWGMVVAMTRKFQRTEQVAP